MASNSLNQARTDRRRWKVCKTKKPPPYVPPACGTGSFWIGLSLDRSYSFANPAVSIWGQVRLVKAPDICYFFSQRTYSQIEMNIYAVTYTDPFRVTCSLSIWVHGSWSVLLLTPIQTFDPRKVYSWAVPITSKIGPDAPLWTASFLRLSTIPLKGWSNPWIGYP